MKMFADFLYDGGDGRKVRVFLPQTSDHHSEVKIRASFLSMVLAIKKRKDTHVNMYASTYKSTLREIIIH